MRSCSDQSTRTSDKPLSRATALKDLVIPLTASAHDIYFIDDAGGLQDVQRYVRFDLSARDRMEGGTESKPYAGRWGSWELATLGDPIPIIS